MRVRLPLGRTLFVLAFFALAVIALLPLRVALGGFGFPGHGLSARAATGSVWAGALQEARLGPVALGDVEARLDFLPLLFGRARLSLEGADEVAPFEGAALASRHGFGFEDVTGRFRLGGWPAQLPLASIDLQDVSVGFASGRCARAEGRVRAAPAGEVAGVALGGGLSGNIRCAEEALLLPLASPTGQERLDLRLFANGRYRAELFVRTADPAAASRFQAAGFRAAGGGYLLRLDGSF